MRLQKNKKIKNQKKCQATDRREEWVSHSFQYISRRTFSGLTWNKKAKQKSLEKTPFFFCPKSAFNSRITISSDRGHGIFSLVWFWFFFFQLQRQCIHWHNATAAPVPPPAQWHIDLVDQAQRIHATICHASLQENNLKDLLFVCQCEAYPMPIRFHKWKLKRRKAQDIIAVIKCMRAQCPLPNRLCV